MAKSRDCDCVDTHTAIRLFEDWNREQRDIIAEVGRTIPRVNRNMVKFSQIESSVNFVLSILVCPQFSNLVCGTYMYIIFISNYLVKKLLYSRLENSFPKTFALLSGSSRDSLRYYIQDSFQLQFASSYVKLNMVHTCVQVCAFDNN